MTSSRATAKEIARGPDAAIAHAGREQERSAKLQRLEARALERLRDILEPNPRWPLWSASEAAWYLIGIHLEHTDLGVTYPNGSYEPARYCWLPGGKERFDDNDLARRDEAVDDAHRYVSGFCQGESRRPRDWIRHSLSKGFEPVWIRIACDDSTCRRRRLLPKAIVRKYCTIAPSQKPQSLGGIAKSKGDDKSIAMRSMHPDFEPWFASCPKRPDGRPRHGEKTKFVRLMAIKLDGEVEMESIANAVTKLVKARLADQAIPSC
jgi:hypothetical protein